MPAPVTPASAASLASPHGAPLDLCLLRTSALGDVTHVLPLLRNLQQALPQARFCWVIGAFERKLVGDITGVEFVSFDKKRGLDGWRDVRRQLAGRRFDALLHMQVALRSNLLSLAINARRRIGYDAARSRDLHGLFVGERILARRGEHALDAIASFSEPLGIARGAARWDIPIPAEATAWAAAQWPDDGQPVLLINACSSHRLRNWHAAGYAAVADHAAARGWRVVLSGGPSAIERAMGDDILTRAHSQPLDLIGKDTLKRALALYQRSQLVLTPDSGPMHMANAVGAPVLGLHAASNPARSGPYSDRRWCVDKYDAAARRFRGKPASALAWGAKIEQPGVMDLIGIDDVLERFNAFVSADNPGRTFPPPDANPAADSLPA